MICERPRELEGLGPGWALEVISRWFQKRSRELGLRAVTRESQYLWSSDDVGEAWGIWLVWALEFISIWFEER